MFERFTNGARRAIVRAQEEARILGHNYIGTEHLLLGMLTEPVGIAARALESLNVTIEAAREQVRQIVGEGSQELTGHIPFTPRAKKVLELALREALSLHSESIGTEHLLLGLAAEGDGVGAQILERLGAPAETVRERVLELIAAAPAERGERAGSAAPGPTESMMASWPPRGARTIRIEAMNEVRDLLRSIDRRLSAIEGHLGIAAEPPEESPPPGEVPPAAAE